MKDFESNNDFSRGVGWRKEEEGIACADEVARDHHSPRRRGGPSIRYWCGVE